MSQEVVGKPLPAMGETDEASLLYTCLPFGMLVDTRGIREKQRSVGSGERNRVEGLLVRTPRGLCSEGRVSTERQLERSR